MLYAKASRCDVARTPVDSLGRTLMLDGFAVEDAEVGANEGWATQRSKIDLQSFLGMVNFCRRFIKNMAHVAQPFTNLKV